MVRNKQARRFWKRKDDDGSTTTFGYDAANQVTGETRSTPNAYTISYAYDGNGNRTSKTVGGVQTNYSYDSHDHLTAAGGKTDAYDANGNCTSVTVNNQTTSLSWTYDNRLAQITYPDNSTNTFQYNGLGLRTQKVDSSGTRNYVCDGASPASTVLADGSAVYSPGSERRSGVSRFRHPDALGSTRAITSSAQATTDAWLHDAFGMTVARTGTTPTPFGFAGGHEYQSDGDSGLMLLGNRYYDPSIGRFISSDPAEAGTNWYAYCGNNPVAGVDPEGLAPPWGANDLVIVIKRPRSLGSQGGHAMIGVPFSGATVQKLWIGFYPGGPGTSSGSGGSSGTGDPFNIVRTRPGEIHVGDSPSEEDLGQGYITVIPVTAEIARGIRRRLGEQLRQPAPPYSTSGRTCATWIQDFLRPIEGRDGQPILLDPGRLVSPTALHRFVDPSGR